MLSVIICSIDDHRFARAVAMYESLLAGEAHEIIRIADARSMCEGYNRGVRQSRGELLVFSHDDIDILLDGGLATRVCGHLEQFDLIGVAGTDKVIGPIWLRAGPPHIFGQVAHRSSPQRPWSINIYGVPSRVVSGIHSIDGLFMAARRELVETIGFDEQAFDGFHLYDADFSFRAHLAGKRVAVVNDIPLVHESLGKEDPAWHRNAAAFLKKHATHLPPNPVHPTFQYQMIAVQTRDEAKRVMTSRFE